MDIPQCVKEDSFTRMEELCFSDCDSHGRARLGTIISLLAQIGGHDFDARGLTYEKLFEIRQVFLLARLSIKIHKQLTFGDILTITTWENGTKGLYLQRNFEITKQDGPLCLSGKSDWILVDPENRKVLRPSSFTERVSTICPKEIDCPDCKKINIVDDNLTELGTRKIVYSDLDFNGHLFSGNYGDIIWDYMPKDIQDKKLREFSINYINEVLLNDELCLKGHYDCDTFMMEGLNNGEHCFTCKCIF